ncbi:unnamed protein product, partial [Rotaria magnacalcarata]
FIVEYFSSSIEKFSIYEQIKASKLTKTTTTTTTGTGGEKGLGSAATAGLACGIIFSALIFTGEILFFKFIYSGGLGNTFGRSAAYAA